MQLNLFLWNTFYTSDGQYVIYALAEDVEKAQAIAIKKAPGDLKEAVQKHVESVKPVTYDEPDSFIFRHGAQRT